MSAGAKRERKENDETYLVEYSLIAIFGWLPCLSELTSQCSYEIPGFSWLWKLIFWAGVLVNIYVKRMKSHEQTSCYVWVTLWDPDFRDILTSALRELASSSVVNPSDHLTVYPVDCSMHLPCP